MKEYQFMEPEQPGTQERIEKSLAKNASLPTAEVLAENNQQEEGGG